MEVSVIGLGRLGAPLAALLAAKGHRVVGVDIDARYVDLLSKGLAPVEEPGLQDLLDIARPRLSATTEVRDAVADTEATLVIVPTPSGPDGTFSLEHVLVAVRKVGEALAAKPNSPHLLVITSTVMPGATSGPIRQELEESSGRRVGEQLGLCYNPEFIALGSVIPDMLAPDFVLVGESDPWAGDRLVEIMGAVWENSPPVQRMNLVNAEVTKLAVNTYVTTKISYANMLSEVCDRLPGADAMVVTTAIGLDTRIGSKFLRPATPYGGPCFPRDNVAFSRLAATVGASADIAAATDQVNRRQVRRFEEAFHDDLASHCRVGILGLSYRPHTNVIEESFGVALAERVAAAGIRPCVFDPAALLPAVRKLGDTVTPASSPAECADKSDLVVVTTPWPEFRNLVDSSHQWTTKKKVVDYWRLFQVDEFEGRAVVLYPGASTL